jgi:hypothetical protein
VRPKKIGKTKLNFERFIRGALVTKLGIQIVKLDSVGLDSPPRGKNRHKGGEMIQCTYPIYQRICAEVGGEGRVLFF